MPMLEHRCSCKAATKIPPPLADHQLSDPTVEQSGCGTKTASRSCLTACTDPCAAAPEVRTPPQVLRREEHAPTSGLASSRSLSTRPRKGEEERRSGSSGPRASPPRNSHRKEKEIAGAIGPDSTEAQRSPGRRSTGPRRSEEDRRGGSGG
ncbi:hypothetical protein NDU88_004166 [Pleurodeles waltl]|uniref:Uncharacterized protein n=1 Tax=Pleurodeles waltl TaxID=8319 RepID=A0AAV7VJI7_PLEWA|nr:hypothetical protein NDU88_004166 [Pleurodeles waltl]